MAVKITLDISMRKLDPTQGLQCCMMTSRVSVTVEIFKSSLIAMYEGSLFLEEG